MIKKDIEALAVTNQNMRVDLNDLLQEKMQWKDTQEFFLVRMMI
jgi:hypothetical protein